MESCFKTFTHELVCVLGIDSQMQSKEINGKKVCRQGRGASKKFGLDANR